MAKRHASSNQALHLKLFQLIEQETHPDEKLLYKQLHLKSQSHYSNLKNYLWNDLLSTLVFLKRKSPLAQLQSLDFELEILLSKNLVDSAEKLLNDAWDIATETESYSNQQNIIKHKYQLLAFADHKRFQAESTHLIAWQQRVLNCLHQEHHLQMHIRELFTLKQFTYLHLNDQQLVRVREIIHETSQLQIEEGRLLLQIRKETVLCMAYHLCYQFLKSEQHAALVLQHWQARGQLIPANNTVFLYGIDYAFYNAFAINRLDLVQHYLDSYDVLTRKWVDKHDNYAWEVTSFNVRLKIYHKTARYELVASLMAQEADHILQIAQTKLSKAQAITLMCSCLISYFVLGAYKRSEDLLMDVKELNMTAGREDVLYFSTIFHMVLLYEMKNYLQLLHLIDASYAKLYHSKQLHPFEKDLMLFLKHLSNQRDKSERIGTIKDFLKSLEHYKHDPIRKLYFLYFNFYDWLESQALDIPYTIHKQMIVNRTATEDLLST